MQQLFRKVRRIRCYGTSRRWFCADGGSRAESSSYFSKWATGVGAFGAVLVPLGVVHLCADNDATHYMLPFACGLLAGATAVGIVGWRRYRSAGMFRSHAKSLSKSLEALRGERDTLLSKIGALQNDNQRQADLEKRLVTAFEQLSRASLVENNERFVSLSQGMLQEMSRNFETKMQEQWRGGSQRLDAVVNPLHKELGVIVGAVRDLEKQRVSAYSSLKKELSHLANTHTLLQSQTGSLMQALRTPHVRGTWGEVHLKRTLELSGMLEYCDFLTQPTLAGGSELNECKSGSKREGGGGGGKRVVLRPDVIVRLPNQRCVVIDSKVPLEPYLKYLEAAEGPVGSQADSIKQQLGLELSKNIRTHVHSLGSKQYWKAINGGAQTVGANDNVSSSPEFVVLFLPAESMFAAALREDPSLIEFACNKGVILSSPCSLVGLLKAVHYGWQNSILQESVNKIAELGTLLHDRLAVASKHLTAVGVHLNKSSSSYNSYIKSLNSRVLVSARKLKDLGVPSTRELEDIATVDIKAMVNNTDTQMQKSS